MEKSLQERFAPKSICFGCGPANGKGLKIRSLPQGEEVFCEWMPEAFHEAFPGVINGGIIGALLDCHSNWTAAYHLMRKNAWERPQCTVTARYSVELKRPTPSGQKLSLRAWVTSIEGDRAEISAELSAGGKVTASSTGLFVAVREGHPAFHRWE